MSPAEALVAATIMPARQLGQAGRFGVIEAGADADLVVLKDNPLEQINTVENPIAVFKIGVQVR